MKRRVSFIHTSPAVLEPLLRFYRSRAPDLEIINVLDDGILYFFEQDSNAAERRLSDLISQVGTYYNPKLVVLTCSAVPRRMLASLRSQAEMPVLKIDEPMARLAVNSGSKIGVLVTFAPALETATQLLIEEGKAKGLKLDLMGKVVPDAYPALLGGDVETHDRLLLEAIQEMETANADAVVLAQVSMARVLPKLQGRSSRPIFSSLETSLEAVREILDARMTAGSPKRQ